MIISVINNKGGTGKTTTAVNLAGALAELGHHTLVIDLDPQASASIYLGATATTLAPSISNVLFDGIGIKSAIRRSPTPHVDLLTADMELIHSDVMLADVPGRERQLRDALEMIEEDYDFIICDCPPYFSMVSVNALVAADAFIIPVTADYLTLGDLGHMMGLVEELRNNMAVDAELLGIVVTMAPKSRGFFNSDSKVAWENINQLRKHYGETVFTTNIGRDTKLADAPAYGTTVFGTARSSRGAKQYMALAKELIERCGILKLKAEARRAARMKAAERRRKGEIVFEPPLSEDQASQSINFRWQGKHDSGSGGAQLTA